MARIRASSLLVAPGGTLTISVTELSPGEWITGFFQVPESPVIPIPVTENGTLHHANSQGSVSWTWTFNTGIPSGDYPLHFLEESGEQYHTFIEVRAGTPPPPPPEAPPLTITPTTVESLSSVHITSSGWKPSSQTTGIESVSVYFGTRRISNIPVGTDGRVDSEYFINATISPGTYSVRLQGVVTGGSLVFSESVSVQVTARSQTLNPKFGFNPTDVGRFGSVEIILSGWAPNEEVEVVSATPSGGCNMLIKVDGAGAARQSVDVDTYYSDGMNSVTATGRISRISRTATLNVSLIGPIIPPEWFGGDIFGIPKGWLIAGGVLIAAVVILPKVLGSGPSIIRIGGGRY